MKRELEKYILYKDNNILHKTKFIYNKFDYDLILKSRSDNKHIWLDEKRLTFFYVSVISITKVLENV